MVVDERTKQRVLQSYFDLEFPASFQSIAKFRNALSRNLNIHLSEKDIRTILRSNLDYVSTIVKPKRFRTLKYYARGVGQESLADVGTIWLKSGSKKYEFLFLLVTDSLSRFAYTCPMNVTKVTPESLRRAFNTLFQKEKMPHWPILRVDLDKSIQYLETHLKYFTKRGVLLRPKRHKLLSLEPTMRVIKSKIIKAFRKNPQVFTTQRATFQTFETLLKTATTSFNNTINIHHLTPQDANSPLQDPYLRRTLYGHERLKPFTDFYTEQIRLLNKMSRPRKKGNRDFRTYHVNDLIMLDSFAPAIASKYNIRRTGQPMYRVARVLTFTKPWIYQIKDLRNVVKPGWYYAAEFEPADFSHLKVEKILSRKKTPGGKKMIKVRFLGYPPPFDRWVEDQ